MKKDKRTNTYLQDTIQKTKDRITRTPLKTGGELMCSRMVGSSYSTSDTCRFTIVKSPVLSHEWGMDREVHTTSDIQVFGDMMHIPFLCFGQLRKNCIQLLFSVYFYLKLIYANFEPEYMWLYRYVWQIYAIYLNQKFCDWNQRLTLAFISNLVLIEKCYTDFFLITIHKNTKHSICQTSNICTYAISNKIAVFHEGQFY